MEGKSLSLVEFWRAFDPVKFPCVHERDQIIANKKLSYFYRSFEDFISDPDFGSIAPDKFHLGLLPVPYGGDILNAEIYILALNPGFNPSDYYAETHHKELVNDKINEIRQENLNQQFPWTALNPKYSGWAGWGYWTKKLADINRRLQKKKGMNYTESLSYLSKKIACLEYLPYHSDQCGVKQRILEQMTSPSEMEMFVQNYVYPKAQRGEAIVIVTRKVRVWKPPNSKNIVIYQGSQARAAHLSMNSPGGRRIAEFWGL